MTCTKDCKLIEEYREEVEAIADCFTEQATERAIAGNTNVDAWADIDRFEQKCVDMAEDLNMKFQGSGVARSVFSVVPDPDEPKSDPQATEFAECVFKFARSKKADHPETGVKQNETEVETYQELTPEEREGTKGRCPLFAPLKQYDEQEYKWIIQPWAPPPGNEASVNVQLRKVGISTRGMDLYSDNIGVYKDTNESCIIDYGFKDIKAARINVPGSKKDELTSLLKERGAFDIEFEAYNAGGGMIRFYVPKALPGQKKPNSKSKIVLDGDGWVKEMDIFFPGFPDAVFTRTEMETELALMDYSAVPNYVEVSEFVDVGRDFIGGNILYESDRPDPVMPSNAIDHLDTIIDAYDSKFSSYVAGYGSGSRPSTSTASATDLSEVGQVNDIDQVREAWRSGLEDIGMRSISINFLSGGLNDPDVRFHPPMDVEPHPSPVRSEMYWNTPGTVESVRYRVAEVELDMFERPDFRTVVRDIADGVNSKYAGEPVSIAGDIAYRETDPVGTGDLYTVEYTVTHGAGFIDPETVIDILADITERHNSRVEQSIPV